MIAELGLIATIGVCAWIVLDAMAWRDRSVFVRLLTLLLSITAWCAGELLLRHVPDAEGQLASRRLLFAGLCAFPPAWLWTVSGLRSPQRALGFVGPVLGIVVAVEAFAYSSLYWAPELLVTGPVEAPQRGVLFLAHAVAGWCAVGLSLGLVFGSIGRLSGERRRAAVVLVVGAATPLIGNWLYFAFGSAWGDPTPILVGCGAVAFRLYALDLMGRSPVAEFARGEIFDQVDVGIFVSDADGRVLDANACGRALLGADDPIDAPLDRLLQRFVRDPGFEVRRFPIVRRGLRVGEGCVVADRREARAQERRAEVGSRMEALGLLSRGVAHEINNPLTVVVGNAALMEPVLEGLVVGARGEEERAAVADLRNLVERVEEAGTRIAGIVERMSHLAKPKLPSAPGLIDVQSLVRRAIGLASFGMPNDRIHFQVPLSVPSVSARSEDVVEIVVHLLRNALEASPPDRSVRVVLEATGPDVRIRVLDRGPGLPPDDPSIVFDPFYTSKAPGGGIGLGLGLCWELARQNGGDLEALHRAGGGAEFCLRLPRA